MGHTVNWFRLVLNWLTVLVTPFLLSETLDMVGHTGKYEAAVKAAAATDQAIGMVLEACNKHNYVMLVTADHGNCERMIVSVFSEFS